MAETFLPGWFNPGVVLILTGLVVGFLPGKSLRAGFSLAGVVIGMLHLWSYGVVPVTAPALYGQVDIMGLDIVSVRIDKLGFIFAFIFCIAAALNAIYGWLHAKKIEVGMGLVYAGAAVGGALAGDFLTLFLYWEIAALSSVFIVWASGDHPAFKAGMRYFVIQVLSGLLLLSGIALRVAAGEGIYFDMLALYDAQGDIVLSSALILLSFGIKAAFPLLHNWLQDSYPKATAIGAVMLSAFTTKLAVYALARSFAGTEILIYIGAVMTVFPVFFALIENDLRKVLAYSLNNQVGFMVCAIGIGTTLSLNGAAAHAFVHILYKSLLFMSMGAVLVRVGSTKATDLGGLHKSMPLTTLFCIVGALSISAFPLFSGFVAKSLIVSAAAYEHLYLIWFVLLFASAGVLEHSGIKIPYFAFFAHDQFHPAKTGNERPKEAPLPMLLAMCIAALLCIGIGVFPSLLYGLLPYEVKYHPYTVDHVVTQMQLLLFSVLAFAILVRYKLYPPEVPSTNLDTDWFYRVPGRMALMFLVRGISSSWYTVWHALIQGTQYAVERLFVTLGPGGILSRSLPVGFMAMCAVFVLGVILFFTVL